MKILVLIFSLFLSFNTFAFNVKTPAKTVVGTGSYTVPAGRWAIVTLSLDCTATASGTGTAPGGQNGGGSSGSGSKSVQLILKAGDALSSSLSNASGSVACLTSSINSGSGTSSVSVTLNASIVQKLSCTAFVMCTGPMTNTFSGTTAYGYVASEYFN